MAGLETVLRDILSPGRDMGLLFFLTLRMPELKPCRALEHFSFDSYLPPSRTVIQFDIRSPSDYSYLTFSAIFHLTPVLQG
jgi:hypothetical protein